MPIPFDVCRCVAASSDEGEIVSPCNTCRRYLERDPSGPRSPWFVDPPRDKYGNCQYHMPTENK